MGDEIKTPEVQEEELNTVVDGFLFLSDEDAQAARTEKKQVEYLMEHMDLENVAQSLTLYQKAVEAETFHTPFGLFFMHRLRGELQKRNIQEPALPPVKVRSVPASKEKATEEVRERIRRNEEEAAERKARENRENHRYLFSVSVLMNVLLVIVVLVMFWIAKTTDHPNIINYENAITNKYATWEQELTEREKAVREKERELHISTEE
ncbi:MAG: hypothetical protein K6A92_10370 [Lachnospiraceae bacterium]|nr:hypothetical protein [Lachnospiraceae bacterium]